jgi:nucleoside 2-deoxyribosyltransferase
MTPTGGLAPPWRARINGLRQALIDLDAEVFNAHHNENWGAGWLPADVCTPVDFVAVGQCDVMCAIVGEPPSGGVTVELGWASALGKPILMVLAPQARCSPLITGLGTVTRVEQLDQPSAWSAEDLAELAERTVKMADGPGGHTEIDPAVLRHLAFCSQQRCQHGEAAGGPAREEVWHG